MFTIVAAYSATDTIITYNGGTANVGWIVVTNTSVATVQANLLFV